MGHSSYVLPFADQAKCKGMDPTIFHPDTWSGGYRAKRDVETAKAVCNLCPVRQACLDWAVEHQEPDGIWGGTTPIERGRNRWPTHSREVG